MLPDADMDPKAAVPVTGTDSNRDYFPSTRISVIDGCRAGSEGAWQQFFTIYGPIIYRFARKARLSTEDAEEVVQNVMRNFMQAFRRGLTVDHELGRFRYYLRKSANREIANQSRRSVRQAASIDEVPPPVGKDNESERVWRELETQERMRQCMDRLRLMPEVRPRDVMAFERYALAGESADIVAKELSMSKSRLYAVKHEMIQRLRLLWTELDGLLGEC